MNASRTDTDLGIVGLLLAYAAKNTRDPFEDFLRGLPDNREGGWSLQEDARETIRLRDEFITHARAVVEGDAREAVHHAAWLARHAGEVAYHWGCLRRAYEEHVRLTPPRLAVRLP